MEVFQKIVILLVLLIWYQIIYQLGILFTAKLLRVRISEFVIGWGPIITRFSLGFTDYSLKLIPISAFSRWEMCNNRFYKILLALAGPVSLLIVSLSFYWWYLITGYQVKNYSGVEIINCDSTLENSAFVEGDLAINFNTFDIHSLDDLFNCIENNDADISEISIARQEIENPIILTGKFHYENEQTKFQKIVVNSSLENKPFSKSMGLKLLPRVLLAEFKNYMNKFKLSIQNVDDIPFANSDFRRIVGVLGILIAILNLLPFRSLVGLMIIQNIVEIITDRPLSERANDFIQIIVLFITMVLFITLSYNSLSSLFNKEKRKEIKRLEPIRQAKLKHTLYWESIVKN